MGDRTSLSWSHELDRIECFHERVGSLCNPELITLFQLEYIDMSNCRATPRMILERFLHHHMLEFVEEQADAEGPH